MSKRSYAHRCAQKAGKVRDYFTCQACGSKEYVEGHHILEHQFLGSAIADNIVTLCSKCHKEVHRGNIDIITF